MRDKNVLYEEFGVWKGGSIRFEGLPASFSPAMRAGHFSTGGSFRFLAIRAFTSRGWFDDTLPRYEWPSGYDRLVVKIDADLYTSPAYVLAFVAESERPDRPVA